MPLLGQCVTETSISADHVSSEGKPLVRSMTGTDSTDCLVPDARDQITAAACLAPSPDNNQPWAMHWEGNCLEVLHVRQRSVKSDVDDLFSWLAIGAAVENISLAASKLGLRAEVAWHRRPFVTRGEREHVATVRLESGQAHDPLEAHLAQRVTNRHPYDKTSQLASRTVEQLNRSIADTTVHAHWLAGPKSIRAVARLIQTADRIRFENQSFHEELHSVLRFTIEQVEATRDGLDVRTLELPAGIVPVLRFLRPWRRMQCMNRLGLSWSFAKVAEKQVRASAAVVILSTEQRSDEAFLDAGRAMQRFWLQATAKRVAFQPLGSLPLFLLALERVPSRFTPRHARRLQQAKSDLNNLVPGLAQKTPVMVMRLGHALSEPSNRSMRYGKEKIGE